LIDLKIHQQFWLVFHSELLEGKAWGISAAIRWDCTIRILWESDGPLELGKLIETATGLEKVADIVSHNPTISNDDIHGFSRKTVSNPLDKDFTVILFRFLLSAFPGGYYAEPRMY